MVGAGCGLQFLQAGLLHHAFGAYVAVLQDDRGWNKTQLSGAAALQQMESAIIGPFLGWIMDRFGPQGLIRIGVVVFGLGFMLLSLDRDAAPVLRRLHHHRPGLEHVRLLPDQRRAHQLVRALAGPRAVGAVARSRRRRHFRAAGRLVARDASAGARPLSARACSPSRSACRSRW